MIRRWVLLAALLAFISLPIAVRVAGLNAVLGNLGVALLISIVILIGVELWDTTATRPSQGQPEQSQPEQGRRPKGVNRSLIAIVLAGTAFLGDAAAISGVSAKELLTKSTPTAAGPVVTKSSTSPTSPPATTGTTTTTSTTTRPSTTQGPYGRSSMLITDTNERRWSSKVGEVFFHTSFSIAWRGGSVVLSGSESGKKTLYVDDAISLTLRSAKTGAVHSHIFDLSGRNCTASDEISKPIDISHDLTSGVNIVDIKLVNKCAPVEESGPIYLVGAFRRA